MRSFPRVVAKSDGSLWVFVQISEAPEPFPPGAWLPGAELILSRSKSCIVLRGRKGVGPFPGSEHWLVCSEVASHMEIFGFCTWLWAKVFGQGLLNKYLPRLTVCIIWLLIWDDRDLWDDIGMVQFIVSVLASALSISHWSCYYVGCHWLISERVGSVLTKSKPPWFPSNHHSTGYSAK